MNLQVGLNKLSEHEDINHLQERMEYSVRSKKNLGYLSGVNPLITCASKLLRRVIYLPTQENAPDMKELKKEVIRDIEEFERSLLADGIDNSQVLASRYILCAVIDEIISTTQWGEENEWSSASMQTYFHDEAYGGERFFSLLEYLLRNPAAFIFILEFMYLCLSIGFKGKYRISTEGKNELISIKENLFHQIQIIRGRPPVEISPNTMMNISHFRSYFLYKIPRGFFPLIILCTLSLVYGSLTYILHHKEHVFYEKTHIKSQGYLAGTN